MAKAKEETATMLEEFRKARKRVKKLERELIASGIPVPNGDGAPTKYDPKFVKMLPDHMSQGLSFEAFAGIARVAVSTLYEWEKNHEEFSEAKKLGMGLCRVFWEQLGSAGASGHLPGFNAAAYIFNMKNRFDWTDRRDITSGGGKLPAAQPANVVINLPRNGYESGPHMAEKKQGGVK